MAGSTREPSEFQEKTSQRSLSRLYSDMQLMLQNIVVAYLCIFPSLPIVTLPYWLKWAFKYGSY